MTAAIHHSLRLSVFHNTLGVCLQRAGSRAGLFRRYMQAVGVWDLDAQGVVGVYVDGRISRAF
jgi:hypothetical protein